jgi:retron-type reverse transcriptase
VFIETLNEHIQDGRFIRFTQELLDAGYMEDWTFNETPSGVPQGGIVSPILSNILLDKLDKYVETVLIPKYTRGARKGRNNEYQKLILQSWRQRRIGNVEKAEKLRKQAQGLHLTKDDPNYRRLKYIRYADDFLLGFSGPNQKQKKSSNNSENFCKTCSSWNSQRRKRLSHMREARQHDFLGMK